MIWYTILRQIAYWCLSAMYNWLDKNKDGTLEKEELEQSYNEIKDFLSKFKKKEEKTV